MSSDHIHAAGDGNRLAGDEGAVLGSQKRDHAGIVVRFAHSLERNAAHHRVLPFYRVLVGAEDLLHHRRICRPRTYRIEQDVFSRQLASDRFCEGDQTAFTRRINSLVACAGSSGVGSDVHDPPAAALDHARTYSVMHVQGAVKVDPDDLVPKIAVGLEEWHWP